MVEGLQKFGCAEAQRTGVVGKELRSRPKCDGQLLQPDENGGDDSVLDRSGPHNIAAAATGIPFGWGCNPMVDVTWIRGWRLDRFVVHSALASRLGGQGGEGSDELLGLALGDLHAESTEHQAEAAEDLADRICGVEDEPEEADPEDDDGAHVPGDAG